MNVRPKGYCWPDFYDHVVDLTRYSFSWRAIGRRFRATGDMTARWMNVVRAVSSEGFGRLKYHKEIRSRLDTDRHLRSYVDQETAELPDFYAAVVRKDLGWLWRWLPEGGLYHDPKAYLKSEGHTDLVSVGR
jgi:hypothetical protein